MGPTKDTGATTRPAVDAILAPGHEVGEYVIEGQIGHGGFGTVYRATHPVIGKRVAIKVLAWRFAHDEDMVSRFVNEARAVNQIGHRNIIDIFAFGRLSDGRHYYAMELLAGETLDRCLERRGALPIAEALPILKAIARALDAAHAKGIAHRDLKPENIFLARDPDGEVFPKLLDFGIAKLLAPDRDLVHRTATGMPLGTPAYMSPEQCRGRDVDHRTDMYSFGVVAYLMLTGAPPFEASDFVDLMFQHTGSDAPRPSSRNPTLPASTDAAIEWMMRKHPADRPATVLAGVTALETGRVPPPRFATPLPQRGTMVTPAVPAPVAPRPAEPSATSQVTTPISVDAAPTIISPPPRRRRLVIASVAVACATLAIVVIQLAGGSESSESKVVDPVPKIDPPPAKPEAVPAKRAEAKPEAVPAKPVSREIEIAGAPTGATVKLDGVAVTGTTLHVPEHGRATLSIGAPGFEPFTQTIDDATPSPLHVNLKRKRPPAPGPPRPISL
jgi:serine/threonine protein kinase